MSAKCPAWDLLLATQVPRAQRAGWKTLGLLVYRFGLVSVWASLSLPGVVLNAPVFLLAKLISMKKQRGKSNVRVVEVILTATPEALASSTVKIAARDVVGTWKVLISLVVVPFLYSAYAAIATLIVIRAGAPLKWRIWTPFLVLSVLPIMSYGALKFGEAGMDVLKCAFILSNDIRTEFLPQISPATNAVAHARPVEATGSCQEHARADIRGAHGGHRPLWPSTV